MEWEELRVTLNTIAEGPNKDSLKEKVARLGEDFWCMELVVSTRNGKLAFVDLMATDE